MVSIRNFYHPLDAAILWSGLTSFEAEIRQVDVSSPDKLLHCFPQWPILHAYTERIYDAIVCRELPATFLGQPVASEGSVEWAFLTIRHSDLRMWIARYYPDDKPSFLFGSANAHSHCISLGAYLAQSAELQAQQRELEKLRQELITLSSDLEALLSERQAQSNQLDGYDVPSELSNMVFHMIIGSLLEVTLGKSRDGQVQSIYKNQAAIVQAIITRCPTIPGLSKRTLDRKFAEARRNLAKALQA